jgi:hypothetical protein
MYKTPVQQYEEIMRMGRRIHQEHDWRMQHGSKIVQPTPRRFNTRQAIRLEHPSVRVDQPWAWLQVTLYITACIGSAFLMLWYFCPNIWG